jgi:hypothetical protein
MNKLVKFVITNPKNRSGGKTMNKLIPIHKACKKNIYECKCNKKIHKYKGEK